MSEEGQIASGYTEGSKIASGLREISSSIDYATNKTYPQGHLNPDYTKIQQIEKIIECEFMKKKLQVLGITVDDMPSCHDNLKKWRAYSDRNKIQKK